MERAAGEFAQSETSRSEKSNTTYGRGDKMIRTSYIGPAPRIPPHLLPTSLPLVQFLRYGMAAPAPGRRPAQGPYPLLEEYARRPARKRVFLEGAPAMASERWVHAAPTLSARLGAFVAEVEQGV